VDDPIHSQYIFSSLDSGDAVGGSLTLKTRRFLAAVRKAERILGQPVDLLDTMELSVGRYVM
jgi:hypothetical protein